MMIDKIFKIGQWLPSASTRIESVKPSIGLDSSQKSSDRDGDGHSYSKPKRYPQLSDQQWQNLLDKLQQLQQTLEPSFTYTWEVNSDTQIRWITLIQNKTQYTKKIPDFQLWDLLESSELKSFWFKKTA